MTLRLTTQKALNEAITGLCATAPQFNNVISAVGKPKLRKSVGGFEGLFQIIVEQQLSLASAAAIWGRVHAGVQPMAADRVLAMDDETLRSFGLSAAKVRYGKALAAEITEGGLILDSLTKLSAEDAIERLTRIKGIGPWTAEVYLLFSLGHGDILPAGDLALQESAKLLFELEERPDIKSFRQMGEAWQPWRGTASLLLWSWYRHAKGMKQAGADEKS